MNVDDCSQNLEICLQVAIGNNDTPAVCRCFGDRLQCALALGCNEFNGDLDFCRFYSGCTVDECLKGNSGFSCDDNTLLNCYQRGENCFETANNDTTKLCNCNGKYGDCLIKNGCMSQSQYSNYVQNCASYGTCSEEQCSGNNTLIESWE